jgi:DedD protein
VADLNEARSTLESPAMDADGLPIAYSLQVATMADKARAESLRDELVSAGYKGYVKRMRRDDRVLYRVLVGPRYSRDELLPVKGAVDKTWRVESLIIRYLP